MESLINKWVWLLRQNAILWVSVRAEIGLTVIGFQKNKTPIALWLSEGKIMEKKISLKIARGHDLDNNRKINFGSAKTYKFPGVSLESQSPSWSKKTPVLQ